MSHQLEREISGTTLAEFKEGFERFDVKGEGRITTNSLGDALASCGAKVPGFKVRDICDSYKDGFISWEDFLKVLTSVKTKNTFKANIKPIAEVKAINTQGGSDKSSDWVTHSYAEEEKLAFVDWINFRLSKDEYYSSFGKGCLPIKEDGEALFVALKDGILLNKLINDSVEDTVDERAMNMINNKLKKLSVFQMRENQTIVLNSCVSIGCNVVNIGAEDLIEGKPHLCLGLLWQVIRIGLMAKITLRDCPGLRALLDEFESLEQLLAMSPEEILCRWVNYQLNKVGCKRTIKNFTNDIKDSEVYTHLLCAVCPDDKGPISMDPLSTSELPPALTISIETIRQISDLTRRAEMVLENAEVLDARSFVRAKDIVSGNQKLNLAFVANLFNMYPAMDDVGDFEIIEETREEKTMRNWMNSLGATPRVKYIYEDLKDGLAMIQLYDKIQPGCVNWKNVNTPPFKALGGAMKQIENCNYAVNLGSGLGFVLVGIDGKNIHDGDRLTLAVVWQMMRYYTLAMLTLDGKILKDNEIIAWCNNKLEAAGKESRISGFKDSSISTAMPVLDLIDAISPGVIRYDTVTAASNEDEKFLNARYAITMARRVGARVFALPADITEVNPKMMLTVFASLMSVGFAKDIQK